MITKQQYTKYEKIRKSGMTKMFDIRTVTAQTGLTKSEILEIIKNYEELNNKFNEV